MANIQNAIKAATANGIDLDPTSVSFYLGYEAGVRQKQAQAKAGTFPGVVAVTGAAGFIASQTVKQLLEKGYEVHGTVRSCEDSSHLSALESALPGKLVLFEADLTDASAWDAPFKGCSIVFHIAAHVGGWTEDPIKEVVTPNVEGTKNVLNAAKRQGVARVVMTSSVYGVWDCLVPTPPKNGSLYTVEDWNPSITEETLRAEGKWKGNGWATYGASKAISERAAVDCAKELNLDLVRICPGVVFGPLVGPGGATMAVLASGAQEPCPFFVGAIFPAVDVRDVARAHIAAGEKKSANGRYIVMHRKTFDQKDFAEPLAEAFPALGIEVPAEHVGIDKMDNSRALELLGSDLIDSKTMVTDAFRSLIATGVVKY